ncbi:glycoside hydrolase 43 family protein [Pedobacter sp. WC2423]|uniref:glycoside hydrolase family 43 protein n=1 Tax=Pedobacter sp. WC2423 TaxID=3234142 RepID=UPI003467D1CC
MKKLTVIILAIFIPSFFNQSKAQKGYTGKQPVIFADVPDASVIRVGDTYYMSSTTMHMTPGVPVMKSKDLVNWKIVSYACETLGNGDQMNLNKNRNAYGKGTWASSMRYHQGTYYVSTFSQTTGETYIYSTKDIEKGRWKVVSFKPVLHDHSLFFDDDGRVYMIYGSGSIKLAELKSDLSGLKPGTSEQVIIENAVLPPGNTGGLPAEGSQLFKVNGKYYLFNIIWPKGGMRTVVIHRSDQLTGPYESKIGFQDLGIAQGGLIDKANGDWYAYLFRDFGAVGRTPYLLPVKWKDGWPLLGDHGKFPDTLNLPAGKSLIPGIVASDEFKRKKGEADLPLVWQWNHNPENSLWSVSDRAGYLRLKTGRVELDFLQARNTLTQRTIGPFCSGITSVDVSKMKDGDFAGLSLLQKNYGQVGVKITGNHKAVVMILAEDGKPVEKQNIPVSQNRIYLKIDCDFQNRNDTANFFYSLNGSTWIPVGSKLKMSYTIPQFMGYRYGLFNYATKTIGGQADFDYFRITDL